VRPRREREFVCINGDPVEWPHIESSHGVKKPIGPYRWEDPAKRQNAVLVALKEIQEKPWPGDRIGDGVMRVILMAFERELRETGFYDEPPEDVGDGGEGTDREPQRRRRVIRRIRDSEEFD
jgi:hypothetical protein